MESQKYYCWDIILTVRHWKYKGDITRYSSNDYINNDGKKHDNIEDCYTELFLKWFVELEIYDHFFTKEGYEKLDPYFSATISIYSERCEPCYLSPRLKWLKDIDIPNWRQVMFQDWRQVVLRRLSVDYRMFRFLYRKRRRLLKQYFSINFYKEITTINLCMYI